LEANVARKSKKQRGLDELAGALARAGVEFERGVPLAPFTTFKIGGPAGIVAYPYDTDQVAAAVASSAALGVPYIGLGWGSNVLVDDAGFPGLVVTTRKMTYLERDGAVIRAGAGVWLPDVTEFAFENGLSGMEELCDVPGSLGGGVYMNAGCYGRSIGDILIDVTWVERDGTVVSKTRDAVYLGYRESEFTGTERLITELSIALTPGKDAAAIRARMDEIKTIRSTRFPQNYPNCGSVFKRVDLDAAAPFVEKDGTGAYSAGYYIERCGLKNERRGNAQISSLHANFIVNLGGATAADVRALIELAQARVKEQYGIELAREVNYLDASGRH
jgi:UDP-N-acetylmuramate dehydrogenase